MTGYSQPMKNGIILLPILISSFNQICFATDNTLKKQLEVLEKRVDFLEQQVTCMKQIVAEVSNKNRWKEPVYWKRIKKDMTDEEIKKLLGSPARIEEQIFTTWYYHHSSKLHSFIWFDEAKVLGWKAPDY